MVYIRCLLLTARYRYLSRLHIGFLCIFYLTQTFTYVLYVLQFFQMIFFRTICFCFYNHRRHIQQFEVIDKLWQRQFPI